MCLILLSPVRLLLFSRRFMTIPLYPLLLITRGATIPFREFICNILLVPQSIYSPTEDRFTAFAVQPVRSPSAGQLYYGHATGPG